MGRIGEEKKMTKLTVPKCDYCNTPCDPTMPINEYHPTYSCIIGKKKFNFCCPRHMDDWIEKQGSKLKYDDILRIKKEDFHKQWNEIKNRNKDEIINVMLKHGGNIWTKECYPNDFEHVGFCSAWIKKGNHILVSIPYTEIHTVYSCEHWR